LIGAFSLTLTLSLWERGQPSARQVFRQCLPSTPSLVSRQDGERFSPSRREEGRGEETVSKLFDVF